MVSPLSDWENQIVTKLNEKKREFFGDAPVEVIEGSELDVQISEFVQSLIKGFPGPDNGSKFIKSEFSVCPKVRVQFHDLEPVLQEESQGSLFSFEVAKAIDVPQLHHEVFGDFTDSTERLELRNIHFPEGETFEPNQWTEKRAREKPRYIIDGEMTIGEVDTDQNLKTMRLIADIRFGNRELKEHEIQAETRDDETFELIVALSELSLGGKIQQDGTVTLENQKKVDIRELIGDEAVTWIDVAYEYNAQFKLQQKQSSNGVTEMGSVLGC